jgi:hypothetical protein
MKRTIKKICHITLCFKCVFFTPLTLCDTVLLTPEIHTAKRHALCGMDRRKIEFLESMFYFLVHDIHPVFCELADC